MPSTEASWLSSQDMVSVRLQRLKASGAAASPVRRIPSRGHSIPRMMASSKTREVHFAATEINQISPPVLSR
jgi:hypothetical protein